MRYFYIFFSTLLFFIAFSFVSADAVFAQDENGIYTRADWGADESLYKEDKKVQSVDSIYLVPIKAYEASDLAKYCKEWVQNLYYYFTTRLGLADIPAHYLFCNDGKVFQGAKLGVNQDLGITDLKGGVIIFMMMDGESKLKDQNAEAEFQKFMLMVAEENAVNNTNVKVKDMGVILNKKDSSVKFTATNTLRGTYKSIDTQLDLVNNSIKNIVRKLEAKVLDIKLSNSNPKPNDVIEAVINIQNSSKFSLSSEEVASLYAITDNPFDSKSDLYQADDWATNSRIKLTKNDVIAKGESKALSMKLTVPLHSGDFTQAFVLSNYKGEKIPNSEFKINFKINAEGVQVIQIQGTETGKLNVRATPGGNEVVTTVLPGQKYIVLGNEGGYYKIKVGAKEGWVSNKYAKIVSLN